MGIKQILFGAGGCICLVLGAVGSVLPLLPTVPFLLLAAFCFANSSSRLHLWFVHTRLYRENLESYVQGRGMTRRAKLRVGGTLTVLMGVGFFMMRQIPVGRVVLLCVWTLHMLYLWLGVRTVGH